MHPTLGYLVHSTNSVQLSLNQSKPSPQVSKSSPPEAPVWRGQIHRCYLSAFKLHPNDSVSIDHFYHPSLFSTVRWFHHNLLTSTFA